ncbi:MAG: DUF393 domain-containing protein [Campylobacterales bacterium]|nr:DUF393 domain-containing protein [Campylobacterales bacterium]
MKIILFDGECGICSKSVEFIFSIDKKGIFYFAPLESAIAKEKLAQNGVNNPNPNTFYYLDKERLYTKSTGALRVLKDAGRGWQLLYVFIIIPRFVRDFIYDLIAKNRYRFIKKSACAMPSKAFLDRVLR